MKTFLWFFSAAVFALVLGLCIIFVVYLQLPDVKEITQCPKAAISGRALCPTSPYYVKLEQVSDHLKQAVLLSEDAAFYTHSGFDWNEIQNSFWTNVEEGAYVRGGSTITQQLAKNVWLSGEKSLTRKLTEAFLASRLEKHISKKQIFEYYLNVIEWGPNTYGIKQASSHYFGKPASQINPAEAAYLAYLLPNPKVYSRGKFPNELTRYGNERVRELLGRMRRYKRITQGEYLAARRHLGDEVSMADDRLPGDPESEPIEPPETQLEAQVEELPEAHSEYDNLEEEPLPEATEEAPSEPIEFGPEAPPQPSMPPESDDNDEPEAVLVE